jgi:hypothetical protein
MRFALPLAVDWMIRGPESALFQMERTENEK